MSHFFLQHYIKQKFFGSQGKVVWVPVDKKQGYLPYLSQKTEFVATTSAEKREITFFILIRFIILQRKMFNANKYQMMKTKEFPGRDDVQ